MPPAIFYETQKDTASMRLSEPQFPIRKETYKIKSRTLGNIWVSFSNHAYARKDERQLSLIELLASLTEASDMLHSVSDDGDILLVCPKIDACLVLSVSTFKEVLYFNIITVMDKIPRTESGELRFHHISHYITL